jgi:hypothetical protein
MKVSVLGPRCKLRRARRLGVADQAANRGSIAQRFRQGCLDRVRCAALQVEICGQEAEDGRRLAFRRR